MSNIITSNYNGIDVFFQDDAFLNATTIAAHFNKKPIEWLRLPTTEEYINTLCQKQEVEKSHFIKTTKGKGKNGTWLHRRLAVAFARWLNVEFAIWCDEQIEKILIDKTQPQSQQVTITDPTLTPKQQYQIQELVQGVHVHTEMSYAEIYSRLKNKFKVAKYDQIPQSRYREAIQYLGGLPMMDMPKQVTFSMFEVLPFAIMLGHLRTLMVDFDIIHSQLKNKDDTLAKMLDNHYRQFNSSAPLFHRVQSAIARLIDSLPEKEREFAFDMVYKI